MFAVNRKSLGEFKVNSFYLAQFSISTLPEMFPENVEMKNGLEWVKRNDNL